MNTFVYICYICICIHTHTHIDAHYLYSYKYIIGTCTIFILKITKNISKLVVLSKSLDKPRFYEHLENSN